MTNHASPFFEWHANKGLPHDSGDLLHYRRCWCNPVEIWMNPCGVERTPALVIHNTAVPYSNEELHNIFTMVLGSDFNVPPGPEDDDWDDSDD